MLFGGVLTTFNFNVAQIGTTWSYVQNLNDGPVSFTATLNLTAYTSTGNVSNGTLGAANAQLNASANGVGVGSSGSLINANEALQFSLNITNVAGGQLEFLGFRTITFSGFDLDDSAVIYSAPNGPLVRTVSVPSTSFDFASLTTPFTGSSFVLFGNTDFDRNGNLAVSPTSFRVRSLQASFASVPEPSLLTALVILMLSSTGTIFRSRLSTLRSRISRRLCCY